MSKHQVIDWSFKSFCTAFRGVRARVLFILDSPDEATLDIISACPFTNDREIVNTQDGGDMPNGNLVTFLAQLEAGQHAKEPVLLVEDDYWWVPGAGKKMEDISNKFDFVTPYDHPNYYKHESHTVPRRIYFEDNQHWQEVFSTTLTFMAKDGETLRKVKPIFERYGTADFPAWLEITKDHSLVAPVGTLATHMETQWLSPGFNESFFY